MYNRIKVEATQVHMCVHRYMHTNYVGTYICIQHMLCITLFIHLRLPKIARFVVCTLGETFLFVYYIRRMVCSHFIMLPSLEKQKSSNI